MLSNQFFFKQAAGAIPYVLIILTFKELVPTPLLRLIVIAIFATAWFVIFQLYILQNSLYKKQLDKLKSKFLN
jgi:hypothetical protein